MRAKVKTSLSKPGSLVQFGVPVLCEPISRAVRQVSYSGRQPSPPPHRPRQRWAVARPAARRRDAERRKSFGAREDVRKAAGDWRARRTAVPPALLLKPPTVCELLAASSVVRCKRLGWPRAGSAAPVFCAGVIWPAPFLPGRWPQVERWFWIER